MKFGVLIGIALAMVFAQPIDRAEAQTWRKLRAADFPARVQSVAFNNGVWDAQRPRVWGKWTARFGAELPVAKFVGCTNSVCPTFRVENLTCANPVTGEERCALTVSWRIPYGNEGSLCTLEVEKQVKEIPVTCPVDIRFE